MKDARLGAALALALLRALWFEPAQAQDNAGYDVWTGERITELEQRVAGPATVETQPAAQVGQTSGEISDVERELAELESRLGTQEGQAETPAQEKQPEEKQE